ncbi:hypothetical protein ACWCPS_03780 [Streptomyces mauvecolor]
MPGAVTSSPRCSAPPCTTRVYLTLTHYQYGALIPQEGGYTFWPSGTQDQEQALGNLTNQPNGAQGVLMRPWLEVLVS